MATRTSVTGSGLLWSATSTWADATVPLDNDTVAIALNSSVIMDVDQSSGATFPNGMAGVTIASHATTPGMLYFKDGTNGYLKIKTGTTLTASGTAAVRGRLLASYSGTWMTTGQLAPAFSGTTGTLSGSDFSPTVAPNWIANSLIGESIIINGTLCAITGNTTTTVTITGSPTTGAWSLVVRPLSQTYTAKIGLITTASIVPTSLDICLLGAQPTTKSVRCYGQIYEDCITTAGGDTFTYGTVEGRVAHGLANGTIVKVSASPGQTLPTPLSLTTEYYVVSSSGNTFKISTSSGGGAVSLTGGQGGAGYAVNVHTGYYAGWTVAGNVLTKTAHGLATDTAVCVTAAVNGLAIDIVYYVTMITADTISLKACLGTMPVLALTGTTTMALYTGTGGTAAAGGMGGTFCTSTYKLNVLDDVTSQSDYWSYGTGTWATSVYNNSVVLVDDNLYTETIDIHRDAIAVAPTATVITLESTTGKIDAALYPNASLVLMSRNVAIQSTCTTAFNIVDYYGATTLSGIFGCEIRNLVNTGTSTTFAGNGVGYGTAHIISGTVSGFNNGVNSGTSYTISGTICACTTGVIYGTSNTISGTISGCTYGFQSGTLQTVSGIVSGCSRGMASGSLHTISGILRGCWFCLYGVTATTLTGTLSGCGYGFIYGSSNEIKGTIRGCGNGIVNGIGFTMSGTISGCYNGQSDGNSHTISGTISGCSFGVRLGSCYLRGATFSGNTADFNSVYDLRGWGVTPGATVINSTYNYAAVNENYTNVLYDYAGSPGYVRAWMPCGTITTGTAAADITTGITYSYKHLGEVPATGGAKLATWLDFPILGKANIPVEITIYFKSDGTNAFTDFLEEPQFGICDPSKVIRSASCVLSNGGNMLTASSVGNGADTWYTARLSYTPTTDMQLILRSYGKCVLAASPATAVHYHWMYTIDSMDHPAVADVRSGTPLWTGASGAGKIGLLPIYVLRTGKI